MKILIVASNSERGFWLAELTHPYFHLAERGCEIEIASPDGGRITYDPISDPFAQGSWSTGDLISKGFLSDSHLASKLSSTIALKDVTPAEYEAIHIVGGCGAADDLYPCTEVGRILEHFWATGKVIGAICHGVIALANVPDRLVGRRATGSSRWEDGEMEEVYGHQAMPFRPQVVLENAGVDFIHDRAWGRRVMIDGKLITAQNQMSTAEYSMALDHMLFGDHIVLTTRRKEKHLSVDAVAAE